MNYVTAKKTEKEIMYLIGKRIKKAREKQELTQDKLSKITGVGKSTITNIESGLHVPSIMTILRLIKAKGFTLEILLGDLWA